MAVAAHIYQKSNRALGKKHGILAKREKWAGAGRANGDRCCTMKSKKSSHQTASLLIFYTFSAASRGRGRFASDTLVIEFRKCTKTGSADVSKFNKAPFFVRVFVVGRGPAMYANIIAIDTPPGPFLNAQCFWQNLISAKN